MRKLCLSPRVVLATLLCCPGMLAGTIFQSEFNGSTVTTGFYTCYDQASVPNPSKPCQGDGFNSPVLPFVPDWDITGGSVDLMGAYWQQPAGTHSIDMDGFQSRGIIQTHLPLNTVAGQTYLVSFLMAGNPDQPPYVDPANPDAWKTKHLRATVANQSADFTFDVTGHSDQNMGWQQMGFSFVATGNDYLTFMSMTPDAPLVDAYSWGAALDGVTVSDQPPDPAIPEPGTLSLALGGLLLLAVILARK